MMMRRSFIPLLGRMFHFRGRIMILTAGPSNTSWTALSPPLDTLIISSSFVTPNGNSSISFLVVWIQLFFQHRGEALGSIFMSMVIAAVEALDVARVVELCEDAELTSAEQNDVHPYPVFHLLGLLLQEDLNEARFLWKRLPPLCQENAETKAAWKLGQALWKRDNREFFKAAEQRHWTQEAGHLVQELVRRKKEAAKRLVERSYSCIAMQRAGELMGLDPTALLQLCQAEDWVVEDNFIIITKVQTSHKIPDHTAVQQSELQVLTEQLIKLQTTS